DGAETALHAFQGGTDGITPLGGLTLDKDGNLYGVTAFGGGGTGCNQGSQGCGTVFKIGHDHKEAVLYAFCGGSDGWFASGNMVMDSGGILYGVTEEGGSTSCANGAAGCGTLFKLAPDGNETVLYSFKSGSDGNEPAAGLIADNSGNFYGTTL